MQQDELLIRRAQKGDADAFETLMAPLEKRVYALCLRMAGNREDALDCAQEAMLRIWRALPAYRREASFHTWAFRVASNTCLDMLRKRKNRPSVSLDSMEESGVFLPDTGGGDPQRHAEQSDRKQTLENAIASLPEELRMAVVLRDVQGFSYDEVASMLSTPLGTVKSRINRARERLRGILSQNAELFGASNVYANERRKDA